MNDNDKSFILDAQYVKGEARSALRTMKSCWILALVLGIVYAIGALIAWDLNAGHWSLLWRFWVFGWAAFWGLVVWMNLDW